MQHQGNGTASQTPVVAARVSIDDLAPAANAMRRLAATPARAERWQTSTRPFGGDGDTTGGLSGVHATIDGKHPPAGGDVTVGGDSSDTSAQLAPTFTQRSAGRITCRG
jgi:hypothetical protein